MKIVSPLVMITACLALWSSVALAATDSYRRDLQTGDWIFTLQNPDTSISEQKVWRYTPTNQFLPKVRQSIGWNGRNFEYDYRVHNDNKSKQSIAYFFIKDGLMRMPDAPIAGILNYKDYPSTAEWLDAERAIRDLQKEYIKKQLSSPPNWRGRIVIEKNGVANNFGWFASPNDVTSDIAPGKTLRGMSISRPELPGIGLAQMQGATKEHGRAAGFPETGPLADIWEEIDAQDTLYVPVLAPAVPVPVPYSSSALAKAIKTEVQQWEQLGVAKREAVEQLSRELDVLILSLDYNNKAGAKSSIRDIMKLIYRHHETLNERKIDTDDNEHDTKPLPAKRSKFQITPTISNEEPFINRVAARSLAFNLQYLSARMEIGR